MRPLLSSIVVTLIAVIFFYDIAIAQNLPLQPETIQRGSAPQKIVSGEAVRLAPLATDTRMRLTFVVMPKRDELSAYADDVNNPQSVNFHKYLSIDEVKSRFMAPDSDVAAIEAWGQQAGLSTTYKWPTNHALVMEGLVAQVNALLHVSMGRYSIGASTYYSNDTTPSVPAALAPKIADILGLNSIEHPTPRVSGGTPAVVHLDTPSFTTGAFISSADVRVEADAGKPHGRLEPSLKPQISGPLRSPVYEPEDIWSSQAYNFGNLAKFTHCCNPEGLATGAPIETSIAVIGDDKPDPNDLNGFFNTFNLASNVTITSVGSPSCCDTEMTMDVEWSGAMSNSFASSKDTAPIHVYAGDNGGKSGLLHAWEQALNDNKTRIATSSYGNIESDLGGLFTPSISDFTDITRAMTAMGWTLIAASGDQGADSSCDERGSVIYPASDPNFLAAGGTVLNLSAPLAFNSETAWAGNSCGPSGQRNAGGGGGGCSNDTFHALPWNPTACNGNRRAIPDMSLNAGNLQTVYYSYAGCTNHICTFGGTSIAAPELAGFFAQENSYLLRLGNLCGPEHFSACAPLGKPTPILFAAASQPHNPFYDIVTGCTSNGLSAGYCTTKGYDLATGLGSANMMQLAWAINYYLLNSGSTPPVIRFSGAQIGDLYTNDVNVNFEIFGANRGVAGYTASLDNDPGDPKSHANPGTGDPFWDGPQVINATSGAVHIPYSEGCHTVYVRAWDNIGNSNSVANYGPICMAKGLQCSLEEGGCSSKGGEEYYTLTCPKDMNFYIFGKFASSGTSITGQNQPEHQHTNLRACVPGSDLCQTFIFASTQTCPLFPVVPPEPNPIYKSCVDCTDTGRKCIKVPSGFQCKGKAR